jgi:hypothetical protein
MDIVEKRIEQSKVLYHVQYICDRLKSLHPKFNLYFLYYRELMGIVEKLARTENAFLYLGTSLSTLTAKFGKNLAVLQHLLNRSYQYYPTVRII